MSKHLSPEQQSEGQGWSIYDGVYDGVSNPVDPTVIEFIVGVAQEPTYSEETRHRVIMGNMAIYAMMLCNFGLTVNEDARKMVGTNVARLTQQPFSEADTKLRSDANGLDLPDAPVFEALAEMEAQQFINSYERRLIEDAFMKRMIEEKKTYDLRVIEDAFGIILSEKSAPESSE